MKTVNILIYAIVIITMMNIMSVPGYAIEQTTESIVQYLEIMTGDEKGNMNLEQEVTRAELTKMLVMASSLKDEVNANSYISVFSDVSYNHWAAGYIKAALDAGWVTGYIDGSFKPNQSVKLEEAVTMVLRVIGYDQTTLKGVYPYAQLNQYSALELDRGIVKAKGDNLTREDCAILFVNLLESETYQGTYYANELGYELDSDNHMDYDLLIEEDLVGPLVVTNETWYLDLPFKDYEGIYYKDTKSVIREEIYTNDVYYYNPISKEVRVFSDKILGTITAIEPSINNPKTITVSGNSVDVSTKAAIQKIELNGKYAIGDKVALLLGSDKTVVDVIDIDDIDGVRYGYVTGSSVISSKKADGTSYVAKVVKVAEMDGNEYSYIYDKADNYVVGSLVEISFSGDGINVKMAELHNMSGLFSVTNMTLSGYPLAKDVKIMDTNYNGKYSIVYPQRLDNITLFSTNIYSVFYNEKNEIDTIFLRDATGDLSNYGYLTSIEENYATTQDKDGAAIKMLTSKTYSFYLNGIEKKMTVDPYKWNLNMGGIYIVYDTDGIIFWMSNIITAEVDTITQTKVLSNGKTYMLSDEVEAYYYDKGNYYKVEASAIMDTEKYDLTAYYDSGHKVGGLVRLMIASDK